MLYLATRFVWFLLAALGLGFAMGWISQSEGRARFRSPAWIAIALLWAAGAALVWLQFVNGVPATWVETALLFIAVYWLGCIAGGFIRSLGISTQQAGSASAKTSPMKAGASEAGREPMAAGPAASLSQAQNEDALPGLRPAALAAAHEGKADDLKLIKGIGHQNEGRLHGLGVWHFEQIAAWTAENVEWVGGYLAFPGRIEREDWVGQAQTLASGGETEFATRARAGLVETSLDDGSAGQDNIAGPSPEGHDWGSAKS